MSPTSNWIITLRSTSYNRPFSIEINFHFQKRFFRYAKIKLKIREPAQLQTPLIHYFETQGYYYFIQNKNFFLYILQLKCGNFWRKTQSENIENEKYIFKVFYNPQQNNVSNT